MKHQAPNPLQTLQREFAELLRAAQAPPGRMAIYHNNRLANFRKALALTFPVVEALVGAEYFAQLARRYQTTEPSRQGDLQAVGAAFPRFLQTHFAALENPDRYAYIAEVARLEAAFQTSLLAADATALAPTALAAHTPAGWPVLRFELHPAARILELTWPVFTLWQAHRQHQVQAMQLTAQPQWVQITRRNDARGQPYSEVKLLEPAAGRFLAALARGETLGTATEAAWHEAAGFDLTATLACSFAEGLFRALAAERPEGGAN